MTGEPLLILGSGTFATETLDIAEASGLFEPLGFVNSVTRPAHGATHAGLPVFWVDDVPFAPGSCRVVAGIVSPQRRAFVELMVARGWTLASVVHPSATVSRRARMGPGCVVNAGVVVSQGSVLSGNVVVNRGALIGHDVEVGAFCTIGPGANVAGGVTIGEGASISVGAVVRDHVAIGAESVVGAGAVVVKPVPPGVVVMGVPAAVVRTVAGPL